MKDYTPSRFANKSLIPPTIDTHPHRDVRLPDSTSTSHRDEPAAGAPAPAGGASEDWTGKTAAFLDAEPEPAAPGPAPAQSRPELCEHFRHSGWSPIRKRVDTALAALSCVSPRRLGAFRFCGSDAYVECRQFGYTGTLAEYRVKSTKCHDRFCLPCSQERARKYRDVLMAHMMPKKNLKLVTLTLRASEDQLTTILDRVSRHFKKLRNTPLWKKACKGGVSIIETKIGEGSGAWHVHLHVIAETEFMDQRKLADTWLKITGDSRIVDIRVVGAKSGAVSYVTKYVTKAADNSIMKSPVHLMQAIRAFAGRRLVSTFGAWRGLVLSEVDYEEEQPPANAGPWHCVGSLDAIIAAALKGDPSSLRIMRTLAPRKFEPSG